jgi:hypothetical protein
VLPIASTTITVTRPVLDATRDSYDPEPSPPTTVATQVRAHISSPSGSEIQLGGSQAVTQYRLDADPVDLRHIDRVLDESSSILYEVLWAVSRTGYGLDHVEAALRLVEGEV